MLRDGITVFCIVCDVQAIAGKRVDSFWVEPSIITNDANVGTADAVAPIDCDSCFPLVVTHHNGDRQVLLMVREKL